jgi:nucleoside-diphosphate-sugar epimerase
MTTSLAGQTVVVMGATGQQGGATARHLLAEGYSVRAVVRDPRSPGSQRLANIGVELVVGDRTTANRFERPCAVPTEFSAFSRRSSRRPSRRTSCSEA